MCFDPLTMLAVGGTVASSYGALQQGAAARTAGDQANAEAQFNAAQIGRAAGERVQAGALEQDNLRTRQRLQMGQARANAAASGVQMEGSPLEAMAFQAEQNARDLETIAQQTGMDVRDLYTQADTERLRGRSARRAGQQAQQASYFRAGTALLQGAGTWARRGAG